MAKVYIFFADGFEEIEGLTVVDLLRRAEIEITMVSITGNRNVLGAHRIALIADALFEEMNYEDAAMLVLPGGMPGTNYLMQHEGLDVLLKELHAKGKPIAAICAASSVLGMKGILNGKNATCYPGFEEKLLGANVLKTSVVVDGNVITSRGMGTAIDFSLSIIHYLIGGNAASKIAEAILYEKNFM